MLRDEPTAFGSNYESAAQLPLQHFIERTRNDEENFIIGAFTGNTLVGSCGGRRDDDVKRRHIGMIWGMYLHPDHRGDGRAAAMLRVTIERLVALPGLEQIQLAVTVGNQAAERLYRSAGFKEYGREPAALKVDGRNYDELLMWLPVSTPSE
jgi:RimJ/RimL family protein N-acetyltransferase